MTSHQPQLLPPQPSPPSPLDGVDKHWKQMADVPVSIAAPSCQATLNKSANGDFCNLLDSTPVINDGFVATMLSQDNRKQWGLARRALHWMETVVPMMKQFRKDLVMTWNIIDLLHAFKISSAAATFHHHNEKS